MPLTTAAASGGPLLTPEEVADLLVRPAFDMSRAAQASTVVPTSSGQYRVPFVATDPTASFVAEGAEIAPSDPDLDELDILPKKLAGLTIISRELAQDTNPEAAEVVGRGLARDIARKLDAAYFGTTTTDGPDGLGSLVGFSPIDAGAAWANLDPFTNGAFTAEDVFAEVNTWVANPADAKLLANLKEATDSNKSLLQPDPTLPTRRTIGGIPLLTSPSVTAGTIWGLPRDRSYVVIRDDAKVESDASVFFTSDRIAVKATMRVSWGWPHPAAVIKVSLTP